jgi:hypothetical protein
MTTGGSFQPPREHGPAGAARSPGGATVTMPMAPPAPDPASTQPTPVMGPAYQAGPAGANGQAPPATAERSRGGRRRLVLIAVGAVAVAAAGIAAITLAAGSAQPKPAAQRTEPGRVAAPPPPTPSPARTSSSAVPSIDSERTDRPPLRLSEVFPARPLALGGRVFKQDKTSVNHDCGLVARGAMAAALVRGHCRGVVRATYVDTKKRYAVTAGVVAMPTRRLAVAVRRAGEPSQYEWFRGMPGKVAQNIDQAGGYAASTVRGRYIIYSYTAYLDGHAAADDRLLASIGRQFVGYAVRPVERRSH